MSLPRVRIGDLVTVRTGKLDANAASTGGEFPFFTCSRTPLLIDRWAFEGDSILIAGNGDLNVKHFIGRFNAYQRTYVIQANSSGRVHMRYLFYFFDKYLETLRRESIGGVIKYIKLGNLTEARIPLPSFDEQRRIATVLDQAEELRAKRRAAIALLDQLPQAIFLEMFGDPASNPIGWPLKRFGDLAAKFSDGPFGSNLKSSHYTDQGIRVWRLQNIGVGELVDKDRAYVSEAHFKTLGKHQCQPGDVIVGTLGEPNLRAFVQPKSVEIALNKADCVQVRPKSDVSDSSYICWLCNSKGMEMLANSGIQGQTRLRISMGRLREIFVPCPPIDLQLQFASRIDALSSVKAAQVSALTELDVLFASLQSSAFACNTTLFGAATK